MILSLAGTRTVPSHTQTSFSCFSKGFVILLLIVLSAGFLHPVLAQSYSVNQPAAVSYSLTPSQPLSDGVIDLEVFDQSDHRVAQQYFEHQNLNSGQVYPYQLNFTPAIAGHYRLKLGIFASGWSQLYYWSNEVESFDVSSASVVSTSVPAQTSNFTISASIYPVSPSTGQSFDVNVDTVSSSTLLDRIIDVEIYDSTDKKVFQQFFDHQTLTANQTLSVKANWQTAIPGKYIVKTGIFTANWSARDAWNSNVSSFDVGQANQALSPTPTSVAVSINNALSSSRYTVGTDGRVYKDGQKIALQGVSWFGFETGSHVAHGLWSRNWQDMIRQIKSTGFNAVRVPFCPATLSNINPTGVDPTANPDLVGLKSLDIMDKIINELNVQKLYTLLDFHSPDCQTITDLWYTSSYSQDQWINDLKFVANRYKNLEYFVGMDLKNEPHGSATWGTGNAATDWNKAAETAGAAVLSTDPNILTFVQGVENNPSCSNGQYGHWWGGDLEPVACTALNLPVNKVVYTPHVYGPDVFDNTYFHAANFPANMSAIWDQHFGFLKNQNKAIAIGEYGGKYGTGGGSPLDVTWQNSFVDYLINKGICDNFYWSWNPNSGDTGGILQNDWTNVWPSKVDLLNRYHAACR